MQACIVYYDRAILTVINVNSLSTLTLLDEQKLLDAYSKEYMLSRDKLTCFSVYSVPDPR